MYSEHKIPVLVISALLFSVLLFSSGVESRGMDCERHCRMHRVSVGNCRCRSELFVKKSFPSESNEGSKEYLLRELIKDYFLQNEEAEDK
ncbi:hypothetical protein JTE90_006412 [Oedothorax gibbosus]|uniref:Uncharacterized protein n=1 Tax=Oedothorax gibbosus TaxID=931172 RepID=A0AAV6VX89_9ARAC|nr:hypothetical protein JTE90_006412 [Oedothorax gibbosus]